MARKTPIQRKKEKLWELCKHVVRKRDGDICVSCGAVGLTGGNQQTGHLIPSSTCGALLRYDLRNLGVQCYACNINKGGNGALFLRAVEKKYGREMVERLFEEKKEKVKLDELFLEDKLYEFSRYLTMSKRELIEITKGL